MMQTERAISKAVFDEAWDSLVREPHPGTLRNLMRIQLKHVGSLDFSPLRDSCIQSLKQALDPSPIQSAATKRLVGEEIDLIRSMINQGDKEISLRTLHTRLGALETVMEREDL